MRKEVRTGKRVKKMLWAGFSHNTRTGLVPLDSDDKSRRGGVTARVISARYSAWLPEFVSPYDIFVHDNTRVHTVRIVGRLLSELGIQVVIWHPCSPDLNPIENLWAIMKREIFKLYSELETAPDTEATLQRLIRAAQEAWHNIDQAVLRSLSDSMPYRVEAIIKAERWYTHW